eukprot:GHVL01020916.1.p1 GENE.GHVL01020916.1~~GHVL01020916.1.p1  ORF type:complete len:348 (-),score=64.50 GHVL01020916.1:104-1147(-)
MKTSMSAIQSANDKTILELFRQSAAASQLSVTSSLSQPGQPLGKAAMLELSSSLRAKAEMIFDANISVYPWLTSHAEYKPYRALVRDECEDKIKEFSKVNDRLVSDIVEKAFETVQKMYHAARHEMEKTILPEVEQVVEDEHRKISEDVLEKFDSKTNHYSDTDSYVTVRSELLKVMSKEFRRLMKKNVDLWKVFSDDATECARLKNRLIHSTTSAWSPLRWWPWAHLSMSRAHLFSCFKEKGEEVQIPESIKEKIFKSWYAEEDLRSERNSVWVTLSITIGILSLGPVYMVYRKLSDSQDFHPQSPLGTYPSGGQYSHYSPQQGGGVDRSWTTPRQGRQPDMYGTK